MCALFGTHCVRTWKDFVGLPVTAGLSILHLSCSVCRSLVYSFCCSLSVTVPLQRDAAHALCYCCCVTAATCTARLLLSYAQSCSMLGSMQVEEDRGLGRVDALDELAKGYKDSSDKAAIVQAVTDKVRATNSVLGSACVHQCLHFRASGEQ